MCFKNFFLLLESFAAAPISPSATVPAKAIKNTWATSSAAQKKSSHHPIVASTDFAPLKDGTTMCGGVHYANPTAFRFTCT